MGTPREPRVAVVGATGAVGNQIVDLIAARAFPAAELKLFATENGSSGTVEAGGEEHLVHALRSPRSLDGFDIAFLAIPERVALEITAARPVPILIDLSAAGRAPSDVAPLVAPGLVDRERVTKLAAGGTFALPHPVAHALAVCLEALGTRVGFVGATALLGASASGRDFIAHMVDQTTDLLSARLDLEEDETQCAFNLVMREHERALATVIAAQTCALLGAEPVLALQAVAAPVLHGTSLAIQLPALEGGIEATDRLRAAPGVLLIEEGESLGITDAVGQEAILVRAESAAASVMLWCAFDNTRLAALDAVWVAETLAFEDQPAN
jgi:aspartate-semialdehyde dehydrogenase